MPAILGQGQEGSSSDGRGGEKMQSNERSETEENILLYMNKTSINISMKESDVTESSETVMAEELNETETSQCKFARKMNRTDKLTSKLGIETDIPVKTEKEDDWIESVRSYRAELLQKLIRQNISKFCYLRIKK